jgi:hypothetical protein
MPSAKMVRRLTACSVTSLLCGVFGGRARPHGRPGSSKVIGYLNDNLE